MIMIPEELYIWRGEEIARLNAEIAELRKQLEARDYALAMASAEIVRLQDRVRDLLAELAAVRSACGANCACVEGHDART